MKKDEFIIIEDFPHCEIDFDKRFSKLSACYDYLFKMIWPNGFACSKCGHNEYWVSFKHIYICKSCEHHHSLTAGTIMDSTKKPITYWFKAMWWFTTRKSGINAVSLQNLLGFGSYSTAWIWLQKLRRCTIRNGREKLSGRVEVDEFFVGGQKPGKKGRGAEGKMVVAIAVERDDKKKKIGRCRLQVLLDCSEDSLKTFIETNIEPGSTIATDSWASYHFVDKEHYKHEQINQSKTSSSNNALYGVHIIISLVKRLIRGTYQGRFEPKYLQNYLDEYVFRFNRRKSRSIGKKFMRIVQQAVKTPKIIGKNILWDMDPISEYYLLGLFR